MTPRQTRRAIRTLRLKFAHARQVRRIVATYKAVRQA
jgi:hypothetical protein